MLKVAKFDKKMENFAGFEEKLAGYINENVHIAYCGNAVFDFLLELRAPNFNAGLLSACGVTLSRFSGLPDNAILVLGKNKDGASYIIAALEFERIGRLNK